jgi:hypothetical protein
VSYHAGPSRPWVGQVLEKQPWRLGRWISPSARQRLTATCRPDQIP